MNQITKILLDLLKSSNPDSLRLAAPFIINSLVAIAPRYVKIEAGKEELFRAGVKKLVDGTIDLIEASDVENLIG